MAVSNIEQLTANNKQKVKPVSETQFQNKRFQLTGFFYDFTMASAFRTRFAYAFIKPKRLSLIPNSGY